MKISVIRHGQTNYNVQHLCNDDPSKDVFLTDEGAWQTEKSAQELRGEEFEAVFVSDLKRTKQTAEIINHYHKVQLKVDSRISDRKTGFDSKPTTDFFTAIRSAPNPLNAKFNDGESFVEEKLTDEEIWEIPEFNNSKVATFDTDLLNDAVPNGPANHNPK